MDAETAVRMPLSAADDGIVLINVFTPRPGQMEALLALQRRAIAELAPLAPGWRGSRLLRGSDGRSAVMVTRFASRQAHERFLQSPAFAAHRAQVLPLIEQAQPGYYEPVVEAGAP